MTLTQKEPIGLQLSGNGARDTAPAPGLIEVAAKLRALSLARGGNLTVLVVPTSEQSAWPLVRGLGRALEHINEPAVLAISLQSSPQPAEDTPNLVTHDFKPGHDPLVDGKQGNALASVVNHGLGLVVATAGLEQGGRDPSAVVTSPRFLALLGDLKERFRFVLIEGGMLARSPETLLLSQSCDLVVLVVRQGKTGIADLRRTRATLARADARIAGFIFEEAG